MSVPNHFWLSLATILCIALNGCSGGPSRDASVSGTVLVDGQLAERGTVTFHPATDGPLAVGRILSDGSYTVRTGKGNLSDVDRGTLKSGDYKVTIVVYGESTEKVGEDGPPKAGPRLTAEKYASVNTTDLQETVKPGGNLFVFELEGAAAKAPPVENDTESDDAAAERSSSDGATERHDQTGDVAEIPSTGESDEAGDSTGTASSEAAGEERP
jgi:hypothetical protein